MPVATYSASKFGIFGGKPSPASLEVFPTGEHMMDEILFIFVFMEKVRRADMAGDVVTIGRKPIVDIRRE